MGAVSDQDVATFCRACQQVAVQEDDTRHQRTLLVKTVKGSQVTRRPFSRCIFESTSIGGRYRHRRSRKRLGEQHSLVSVTRVLSARYQRQSYNEPQIATECTAGRNRCKRKGSGGDGRCREGGSSRVTRLHRHLRKERRCHDCCYLFPHGRRTFPSSQPEIVVPVTDKEGTRHAHTQDAPSQPTLIRK